jgi:hypothetical protein
MRNSGLPSNGCIESDSDVEANPNCRAVRFRYSTSGVSGPRDEALKHSTTAIRLREAGLSHYFGIAYNAAAIG